MSSLCAGLLGAAPTMPLLANPALSAALLQLLLQNQAKAQQVLLPFCFCLLSDMCLLATQLGFDSSSHSFTLFFPLFALFLLYH